MRKIMDEESFAHGFEFAIAFYQSHGDSTTLQEMIDGLRDVATGKNTLICDKEEIVRQELDEGKNRADAEEIADHLLSKVPMKDVLAYNEKAALIVINQLRKI